MSEDNKRVVARAFDDVLNGHKLDLIPDLYHEDLVGCDPANACDMTGHEALADLLIDYRKAFPDHRYDVHDMVAEGDHVCVRWTVTLPAPDAEDCFEVNGISLCQLREGKICKVWQSWDNLGYLRHIGVVDSGATVAGSIMKTE